VEKGTAAGHRCAAAPDVSAALRTWLAERAVARHGAASSSDWLQIAAAVEAAGGASILPLEALGHLIEAVAAATAAELDKGSGASAGAAAAGAAGPVPSSVAAPPGVGSNGWVQEETAPEAALLVARNAFVQRLCDAMLLRLLPAGSGRDSVGGEVSGQSGGSRGEGGGPNHDGRGTEHAASAPFSIERATALLRALCALRVRPPQALLQALLGPLRSALAGATPALLSELACAAADAGALLRASWLTALQAAALRSATAADGTAAAGLLWALARYQRPPPAPGAYSPLLIAVLRGGARLAPAEVVRALLAADRLGVDPDGSWGVQLLDESSGRLGDAGDLFDLAELARAAGAAAAPAQPGEAWCAALRGAALGVAARRAGVVPAGSGPGAVQGSQGTAGAVPQQGATAAGAAAPALLGEEVAALLSMMVRYPWLQPRGSFLSQLLELYAR
jgi:hypothetical protein